MRQHKRPPVYFHGKKRCNIGFIIIVGLIALTFFLISVFLMVAVNQLNLVERQEHNLSIPSQIDTNQVYQLLSSTINPPPVSKFLQKVLSIDSKTGGYLASSLSDTAYLDHCTFQGVDWNDVSYFFSMAMPRNFSDLPTSTMRLNAREEMTLELLEMYASNHSRYCDFKHYRPTVRSEANPDDAAARLRNVPHLDQSSIRLAIAIVAYKDILHLELLVQALYLPQHYIIIHLERQADAAFEEGVRTLAKDYNNVVVLKFGSIVYKTGQVTDINLRIMRWLVMDAGLTFSYFLTLGGAVYPLYSAGDLTRALQVSGRKVWMGTIANSFAPSIAQRTLGRIGLTYSRDMDKVYPLRAPNTRIELGVPIRPDLMALFDKKTNSGNQAIFHYNTVKTLLESPDAMELMANSKYACCCCVEELVWYGAMKLIGLGEEALDFGSMLQFWSGIPKCEGTISNAVLKVDDSSCYLLDDKNARVLWNHTKSMNLIQGSRLKEYLIKAKEAGFLLARKFDSNHQGSVHMRAWIREVLQPMRF